MILYKRKNTLNERELARVDINQTTKKKLDKTREQVGKKYYIRWMGKPTSNKIMFQKLDRSLDFMLHLLLLWNQ